MSLWEGDGTAPAPKTTWPALVGGRDERTSGHVSHCPMAMWSAARRGRTCSLHLSNTAEKFFPLVKFSRGVKSPIRMSRFFLVMKRATALSQSRGMAPHGRIYPMSHVKRICGCVRSRCPTWHQCRSETAETIEVNVAWDSAVDTRHPLRQASKTKVHPTVQGEHHIAAFHQPLWSDSAADRMEIVLIYKTSIESKTKRFCYRR